MDNEKKELNLDDLIREVSGITGFTQKDIRIVAETMNEVVEMSLANGYGIKNHKMFKLTLVDKEGYEAFNGFNNEYYQIPSKKVLKFKPLTRIENAIDKNNSQ